MATENLDQSRLSDYAKLTGQFCPLISEIKCLSDNLGQMGALFEAVRKSDCSSTSNRLLQLGCDYADDLANAADVTQERAGQFLKALTPPAGIDS